MLEPNLFFDLTDVKHHSLFEGAAAVWEPLVRLKDYLKETLRPNIGDFGTGMVQKTVVLWKGEILEEGFEIEEGDPTKGALRVRRSGRELDGASVIEAGAILADPRIQVGRGVRIEAGALIKGPTLIGNRTEVRQGAYIRGNCLIGEACVVGHATEMKAAVLLNGAKAGHFAYIGDSILGNEVNLGAGTKLANLKIIKGEVRIRIDGEDHATGLRKLGAILGDRTETGCNSVTSPGTILGKNSLVYPCVNVPGGCYSGRTIVAARPKAMLHIRTSNSPG